MSWWSPVGDELPLTGGQCIHITGPVGTAIILTVAGIVDPPLDTLESLARVTGLPVFIVDRGDVELVPVATIKVMQRLVEDAERGRRQVEFLEALADGGELKVNGIPWREAFETVNAIIADSLPPEPIT